LIVALFFLLGLAALTVLLFAATWWDSRRLYRQPPRSWQSSPPRPQKQKPARPPREYRLPLALFAVAVLAFVAYVYEQSS
jgi:ABC-type Fe3+ transport system permease subunit